MLKNISKNRENQNKIKILLELHSDEKYINGKASDFELFDEWERCLPLMAGHKEVLKYKKELETLGIPCLKFGEYSRSGSCARWKIIHSESYEEKENNCFFEEPMLECKTPKSEKYDRFSINENVSKYVTECKNYKELTHKIIREATEGKNGEVCIEIDAYKAPYKRPDPHTAELAFNDLASGEKYNYVSIQTLCISIFIELLLGDRQHKIHEVYIRANGNAECASALLEYIHGRGFFVGAVSLEILPEFDVNTLSALTERVYPEILITPILEHFDVEPLKTFAKNYPIGACCAGRNQNIEVLSKVIDSVSDSKEHSDALMNILCLK